MTEADVDSTALPKILKTTNVFYNVLKNCSQASKGNSTMFTSSYSDNRPISPKNKYEPEKKQKMLFYSTRRYRSRKVLHSEKIYHQRRYLPRFRLPYVNPEYALNNDKGLSVDNRIAKVVDNKNLSYKDQETSLLIESNNYLNSYIENAVSKNEINNDRSSVITEPNLFENFIVECQTTGFNQQKHPFASNSPLIEENLMNLKRTPKVSDIKLRFVSTLEALRRMEFASRMLERQKKKLDIRKTEMEKSLKRLRMLYKFYKNMEEGDSAELENQVSQDIALDDCVPRINIESATTIADKVEEFYSRGKNFCINTSKDDIDKRNIPNNILLTELIKENNFIKLHKKDDMHIERAHQVHYRLELPIYEGLPPMPAHKSPVDLTACTYLVLRQI